MGRFFDEDGQIKFKSLGRFRIINLRDYQLWYAGKFIYYPHGETDKVYECFRRFTYDGEPVLTLVKRGGHIVTLIPERFVEKVEDDAGI